MKDYVLITKPGVLLPSCLISLKIFGSAFSDYPFLVFTLIPVHFPLLKNV